MAASRALKKTGRCSTSTSFSDPAVPALIVIATILNGLTIGGDTDLMPYLASRYFGNRAVSRMFG
jgi:hypothetical protein